MTEELEDLDELVIKQCVNCRKYINPVNKPICCGIIYDERMIPPVKQRNTKVIERIRIPKPAPTPKNKRKSYSMDAELREKILKRDKHKCTKCKSKIWLHVHHIVHRKDGGSEDPSNLVTLCDFCHADEHKDDRVYNIMRKGII